jgi:hypothetical protein
MDMRKKTPVIERMEHDAGEAPPGWTVVASVQTNGKDIAVQINEGIIPALDCSKVENMILCLANSLYTVRPDLRRQ